MSVFSPLQNVHRDLNTSAAITLVADNLCHSYPQNWTVRSLVCFSVKYKHNASKYYSFSHPVILSSYFTVPYKSSMAELLCNA